MHWVRTTVTILACLMAMAGVMLLPSYMVTWSKEFGHVSLKMQGIDMNVTGWLSLSIAIMAVILGIVHIVLTVIQKRAAYTAGPTIVFFLFSLTFSSVSFDRTNVELERLDVSMYWYPMDNKEFYINKSVPAVEYDLSDFGPAFDDHCVFEVNESEYNNASVYREDLHTCLLNETAAYGEIWKETGSLYKSIGIGLTIPVLILLWCKHFRVALVMTVSGTLLLSILGLPLYIIIYLVPAYSKALLIDIGGTGVWWHATLGVSLVDSVILTVGTVLLLFGLVGRKKSYTVLAIGIFMSVPVMILFEYLGATAVWYVQMRRDVASPLRTTYYVMTGVSVLLIVILCCKLACDEGTEPVRSTVSSVTVRYIVIAVYEDA